MCARCVAVAAAAAASASASDATHTNAHDARFVHFTPENLVLKRTCARMNARV